MSYYCRYCGKTLTTADFSDRCNPPCNATQSELEKTQLELKAKLNLIKECDALRAENERLKEAIELLQNWVKAYPLDMFPEPDLKLARKLLTDGGVSYDALNVYSMRHVINGVGRIIDEALKEVE